MNTEKLTTKATKIKGIFHVRLFENKKVVSEVACKERKDIGYCCSYLLRWYDKLGGVSKMASASRQRSKNIVPVGKIWFPSQLQKLFK